MIELFLLKAWRRGSLHTGPEWNVTIDSQVSALQWRILKSVTLSLKQIMLFCLMEKHEVHVPRLLADHPVWPGWDLSDLAFLGEVGGACAEKAEWNMPVNHQHLPQGWGASDYIEEGIVFLLNMLLNFWRCLVTSISQEPVFPSD